MATEQIPADLQAALAAIFGPSPEQVDAWNEANPAQFSVGDSVRVVDTNAINNPEMSLSGDLESATGTIVEDSGLIFELGERGYIVQFAGVTWDHPAAPADIERDHFALTESEIAAA